jgi:hypothetical protein
VRWQPSQSRHIDTASITINVNVNVASELDA